MRGIVILERCLLIDSKAESKQLYLSIALVVMYVQNFVELDQVVLPPAPVYRQSFCKKQVSELRGSQD